MSLFGGDKTGIEKYTVYWLKRFYDTMDSDPKAAKLRRYTSA